MAPNGELKNGRLPEGNCLFVNNTSIVSQRLVDAWCSERTQRGELHSCPVCLIAISLRYAFVTVGALVLLFCPTLRAVSKDVGLAPLRFKIRKTQIH